MLRPFSRFCIMIGAIPESIIHSLSYEQQLLRLIKFLKTTVIPAIDGNTTAIKAIEEWIENVDLQEYIDNKLDEMVESGELQEIISAYLNSQAIFGYDTVSDMKSAENLIDGSYAKTLGYYSINDGGSALYKIREITNEDVVDEKFILAMDNDQLVAELVILNEISIKQLGAKGSSDNDDTEYVSASITKLGYAYIPEGTYYMNLSVTSDIDLNIYGTESTILKPYDSGSEIIEISHSSITNPKIIKNLHFELTNSEIGIAIKLPSFVDNYYPQNVKLNNLHFYCANAFSGKCIQLDYIRELNIEDIYVKRDRGNDSSRTGTGLDLTSCMNLNIKNSSFGFLDKAIYIHNGSMSSEGIMVDNVEMFFNNYGVYAQGSSSRAILNLRVQNCMIDQVQTSGITFDGITTGSILNNWFGTNVSNANSIDLKSTNRETFGIIISDNAIFHNNQESSVGIKIDRSNSYNIRFININSNVIYNYHEYGIDITHSTNAINILKVNSNDFGTSSGVTNKPIHYTVAPTNTIVSENYNGGALMSDDNLNLTNNINMVNKNIFGLSDLTIGTTVQNNTNKTLFIVLSCYHTGDDGGRVAVYMGKTQALVSELYTQKIYDETTSGSNQTVVVLVQPYAWYSIVPNANVTVNKAYAVYL